MSTKDKLSKHVRRSALKAGMAGIVAATLGGIGAIPDALAQGAMPSSPVTINIVDPAGNLALPQDAIEEYGKKNPKVVSKFNFTKDPAPEIPGNLKAMRGAGRSDYDLILTGTDSWPQASSRAC